jgi:hypothetical protein
METDPMQGNVSPGLIHPVRQWFLNLQQAQAAGTGTTRLPGIPDCFSSLWKAVSVF